MNVSVLRYDVCIIGAGLTGLLAAREAIKRGKRTLVVERGGEYKPPERPHRPQLIRSGWWHEWVKEVFANKETGERRYRNYWPGCEAYFDDLVAIETVSAPWDFKYNMKYGVGGSAKVWSGNTWRLHPSDFKTKSQFGYGFDWPYDYEVLEPFYAEAEALMHVSGPTGQPNAIWPWTNNYQFPSFPLSYLDLTLAELMGDKACLVPQPVAVRNTSPEENGCVGAKTCVSRCINNALFHPDEVILSELLFDHNFEILTNACVQYLQTRSNGNIQSIKLRSEDADIEIEADTFFLAANGLENIRLLLNSRRRDSKLFSGHDIGNGFTSHGAEVFRLQTHAPVFPSRGRPNTASCIDRLSPCNRKQVGAHMFEVWNSDFSRGYAPWEQMLNLWKDEGQWGASLLNQLKETYEHSFCISFIFETEMCNDKRVELSRTIDKRGLPLARANTALSARDQHTRAEVLGYATELLNSDGIAKFDLIGEGLNGNHPLGGIRIAANDSDGPLDENCRSYQHQNLYVLGGSAFCSTGAVNPTLTIAAMTLKSLANWT